MQLFCGTKVKAIYKGQGQILRSRFSQQTLTLATTFEWQLIGFQYLTNVFLEVRPFL